MRPPISALASVLGLALVAASPSVAFSEPPPANTPIADRSVLVAQQVSGDSRGGNSAASANLFSNGDFENGMNGWSVQAWAKKGRAAVDREERYEGHPTLRVTNSLADNTFVTQTVRLTPGTRYRLGCWVKTTSLSVKQGRGNAGVTLWIAGGWEATKCLKNAEDWSRLEMEFDSGKRTEIQAGPRLGQWGGILTGVAWFADVSLVEVGPSTTGATGPAGPTPSRKEWGSHWK